MKKRGALALVVVLVLAGSVYVVGDRFSWWGSSCKVPQSISREQGDRDASLEESGHVGLLDNGSGLRSKNVVAPGGGAVVRNNKKNRIAYRTKVHFHVTGYRLIGSSNNVQGKSQSADFNVVVPFVMPGQQVGVAGRYPEIERVTMQYVTPKTTTWVSRDELGDGFSPPKSTYLGTVRGGSGRPDEIRYREDSKACRGLSSRYTSVVFRDKKGQIVGGDLLKPKGAARPCSPGRHKFRLPVSNGIPPRADDSRTEVYSNCDLNSPKHDVNKRPS